jgi:hypothetical protein
MRRLAVLSLSLLTCSLLAVSARQLVPVPLVPATPDSQIKDKDGGKKSSPSDNDQDDKGGDAKGKKENSRLQRLKSLNFDRRPSTILKAWSSVPEAPKSDESKKGDTQKQEAKKDTQNDALDLEMTAIQRLVTLGQWQVVRAYLAFLPREEANAGYKQLLQSLASDRTMGPQGPGQEMDPEMMQLQQQNPAVMRFLEKNKFSADDIVGIAKAAPKGLEKEHIAKLGQIARQAIAGGTVIENIVARLQMETSKPPKQAALTAPQAAAILIAAGNAADVGVFLPTVEKALADKDHENLNLLAQHYLALHAKEKKLARLEQAWSAVQAILATPGAERAHQEQALKLAVELAPKIREELGQTWLEQSFTKEPQRGMDILTTLGTTVAQGIQKQPQAKDVRLKTLELQKTAVEALLKAAPDKADNWRAALTLLAGNWLKEAEFSMQFDHSSSYGPRMRRDFYGNMYFMGDDDDEMDGPMMMRGGPPNMPQSIAISKVLDARPADLWIKQVDSGLQPRLQSMYAELYLKVGEEAKAFPFIERIASANPDKGRQLVKEFLKVWGRNHNPNAKKDYTNPYMWMYGFERRVDSIPLTRAKQERNLTELTEWVAKLNTLKLGDVEEEELVKAFTSCHSTAEVYRMEAIEKVFGKLEQLKPRTLAALGQQMRQNLVGLWRSPADQNDKKTNRKLKDIQSEVLRGYELAESVIEDGVKKFPNEWALTLAKAMLMHDENNFRQELTKSSEFTKRREIALGLFATAARQYAAVVKDLPEEETTTLVFEHWMYAGLGACDLKQITDEKIPDVKEPLLIRKAILSLPGETAEKHMSKFANLLFTRLSSVNPAMKFNYLRAGFDVVGAHRLANEARKVFDYYKDLVTEIKLDVAVDGSDAVGNNQPFGLFVNLRHTREIERESGGFGRYLQNQNSGRYFSYNYGRPTTDYRDKFTSIVNEALKEQFEVLSITFQSDKVNSRALPEYGWRFTPYAYLLLKTRGPQVDKIPPIRIDLDFLDTSGYVLIPIESATVPVDASSPTPGARTFRKLQIAQTLDERQADKGKLLLEVKATALGLIPSLDHILTVASPGFEVDKTADQGVSVAKFDADSEENAIVSERTWVVSLKGAPSQSSSPEKFTFGKSKINGAEMAYHRFKDADLVKVDAEIPLEEQYGQGSYAWLWWTLGGVAGGAFLLALMIVLLRRRAPRAQAQLRLPEHLTPFTVLGLLSRIDREKKLDVSQHKELQEAISLMEQRYFADQSNGEMDLKGLAENWLRRT